jgi:simple sugar transport system substrate-binding protein
MKKIQVAGAMAVTGLLLLSACGGTGEEGGGSTTDKDLTYAVITHSGPGDAFWDRVKSGSEQAGDDYGVSVEYSSDPDPSKQSELIDAAVADDVDGVVVSMANPDGLQDSI